MFTQHDCIKYSNEFVNKLKRKGLKIRHALLFGSYATNRQSKDSDIDIALAADEFTGIGYFDIGLIGKELIEYDNIQVKTYQTDYFEQGDPFINEIIKTGIKLIA
ncbi:MAG: nucleotidyltransferase domain-containing protein [FCB group bacterium]|jgi:predicted nucleotidyltransferase